MGNVALVFAGGDRPPPAALVGLPAPDLVIAADSGLDHATALGFGVDMIVGDLDSADPAAVDAAVATGTVVEGHPEAKDATDLELALLAARTHGCERAVVVGGHGGRLDHFLANALLLASPELADLQVEARLGDAHVFVVRGERELRGAVGDLCTLLPLGGPASGVRTEGLRFPLCRETLEPGSTRGVSNELLVPVARVSLDDGVLLAIVVDHETGNR
jgi:thiamine pyrophosphokinase